MWPVMIDCARLRIDKAGKSRRIRVVGDEYAVGSRAKCHFVDAKRIPRVRGDKLGVFVGETILKQGAVTVASIDLVPAREIDHLTRLDPSCYLSWSGL